MTIGSWGILTIFLLVFAGSRAVCAQADEPGSNVTLEEDLRAVIILAGYPCERVGKVSRTRSTEYHVSCPPDRQYRVQISEEERVLVENLSDPSRSTTPDDESHEAFMKRKLFSVINLAGHRCNSVLAYEYRGPRDNLVTCEDQTIYRIHVTPEGHIAVDEQTLDK